MHPGAETTTPNVVITLIVIDGALMSALDGRSGGSQYPRGAVVFEAALSNGPRGPLMAQAAVVLLK